VLIVSNGNYYTLSRQSDMCVYRHILHNVGTLLGQKNKKKKLGHQWMPRAKEIFRRNIRSPALHKENIHFRNLFSLAETVHRPKVRYLHNRYAATERICLLALNTLWQSFESGTATMKLVAEFDSKWAKWFLRLRQPVFLCKSESWDYRTAGPDRIVCQWNEPRMGGGGGSRTNKCQRQYCVVHSWMLFGLRNGLRSWQLSVILDLLPHHDLCLETFRLSCL
jgi:hypothetical protein